MATHRAGRRRLRDGAAGDAACEGSVVGDDREDRPARCARTAQLLRLGRYRPVHAKSASSQEVRALLTARKLMQANRARLLTACPPQEWVGNRH